MVDLSRFCLNPERTLRDALRCINDNSKGIALVVDREHHLLYTVTDGDLRRAILHGFGLDLTLEDWAKRRAVQRDVPPTTAPVDTAPAGLLRMMKVTGLRHIPLLDGEARVVDLALLSDLVSEPELQWTAVVMAGGLGTRLLPLTAAMPKPMLPVGDCPLMEHIVTQLRDAGIRQLSITTHYKPETIMEHFGDGQRFGMSIDYVNEDHPLGTAGALGLMPEPISTLLVVNGDILTRLNYHSMLAFHRESEAVMTVAVSQYDLQVPYGVVQTEGVEIKQISEKPTFRLFVNAGVYLIEPTVTRHFVPWQKLDMTDLISRLLAENQRVASFPISEYWLDVGRHADYEKAQIDFDPGSRR